MKPSREEVLKFAYERIKKHINKWAWNKPLEQQEEASQEAVLKVLEAYERLDEDKCSRWKAFIDLRCRGAVIDYFKLGQGYLEDRKGKETRNNITSRVSNTDLDGNDIDIYQVSEVFELLRGSDPGEDIEINWDLVARMASVDSAIHLLAKLLLGFSMDELEVFFKCPKEHLSRRYRRFLKRLDLPSYARDPWMDQFIYAFGLSEIFHIKAFDNGLAWDCEPVDLYSEKPLKTKTENDGPAYSWISDFISNPDKVNWNLVSRMAAIDEEVCLIALILKGHSRLKLAEIFEDSVESLKSRALRFCKRLDSPDFYHHEWTNQIIYAFGLSEEFHQEARDYGLGYFVAPLDLNSFDNYQKAVKGKNQLNLLAAL